MKSIKTKLILALSVFVIFLFSLTALLLIGEKQNELSRDIYLRARSFSELTTPKIVSLYETLLAEKSFVIFQRDLKDIMRKNEDIAHVNVYTFSGDVLFDSIQEKDRAYDGSPRVLKDPDLLARVRANLPSYLLASGRAVYLKKTPEGEYLSVNENEKEVALVEDRDEILNVVFPFDGRYAVSFGVTYENLKARVYRMTERIVLLLIFGVLLGLGFGTVFSRRITQPIEQLTAGALTLAKGDFSTRVHVKVKDEVGTLADTFNTMAGDLEIATRAMIEKEKISKELEVAAKIQKQIIPAKLPAIPGFELSAALIPATEIGGDCYDIIKTAEDTHIMYLGDVTGHGIPSGIVASIANAIIYSYAGSARLTEILASANKVLKGKTSQNMFMTLIMLMLREDHFSYVSAGHPEMIHYYAREKKVVAEKGGGIALGMVPDIGPLLKEVEVPFSSGDCAAIYSDGIPEALSPRGEQYGMVRLKRILQDTGELQNAEAVKNAIIADVKEFMAGAEQADDITLVVVRRK